MSKIFKSCFKRDSTESVVDFGKMDAHFGTSGRDFGKEPVLGRTEQRNGMMACPFSGASELNVNGQKVMPNLRLKVPQPMKLKNHLVSEDTIDTLHLQLGEVSTNEENRYHEDIFGITLRTAEVHSASRESARRNRVSAQP